MSNLFGGSSSSNKGAQSLFVPAFTSAGGVTGQQSDLAQYLMGEQNLGSANQFGASGTGQSTMATQADAGNMFGEAQQLGQMSDINTGAAYTDYSNAVQSTLSQLASNLPVNNAGLFASEDTLSKIFQNTGPTFTSGNKIG